MENPSEMKEIITLGDWLDTPAGSYVRDWEQARLDILTADVFGFKAVQVGLPQIDALRANRMQHRWLTDACLPFEDGCHNLAKPLATTHSYYDLPFATHSLDLVVLPHVLEFVAEPHQVLREVSRVLIPEGQVIITGFNPVSLWGVRQGFGRVTGRHFLPQNGEFISLHRLKDWLKLLSMESNRGHFGCYQAPFSSPKSFSRYGFMDKAGNRWWPYFGGVYIVQAIKRVRGMTLVGLVRSKPIPQLINIPVTGKSGHTKNGQH